MPKPKAKKPDLRGYSTTSVPAKPVPQKTPPPPPLEPAAAQPVEGPAQSSPETESLLPAAVVAPAVASPFVPRPPGKEAPSATCAIVRVPFADEELAIAELRAMNDQLFSEVPREVNSRLWTFEKLEAVYEELREAGFQIPDVERALELCGPVTSDCFDYLSLALPATRLPKGWAAEGVAVEASAKQEIQVLTVTKPKPKPPTELALAQADADERVPSPILPAVQQQKQQQLQHDPRPAREQEDKIDKKWILQRLQAMDSDSDDDGHGSAALVQTPEERLDEAKKQLKAEKNPVERARLAGVVKELSVALAKPPKTAAAPAAANVDKEEDALRDSAVPDIDFDLLFTPADVDATATTTAMPSAPLFDGTLPPGWSAPPPKLVLQDVAKKRMLDPPLFKALCDIPNHFRYSVAVAGESYEHASRCLTKSLAQDLVSTRALYALLGASSQTRTLLPPVFRDLWTAWANEDEQARLALIERDRGARVEFVRRVLASRAQSTAVAAAAGEQTAADAKQEARGRRAQGIPPSLDLQAVLDARQGRRVVASHLPIWQVRDDIISALEESDFLVVVGETGSGKTTQVPVFLLEHAAAMCAAVKLAVAEPRRISATSVARRVGEELGDEPGFGPGALAGFAIRGESTVKPTTRVMFCTTGVLLRQLQDDPMLSSFSHVIVDEVHERSVDSDFLIVHLKRIVAAKRSPPLKVVLMSATVNAQIWSKYLGDAPIVQAQGRAFPVQTFGLDAALLLTDYALEADSEFASKDSASWQTAQVRMRGRDGVRAQTTVGFDADPEVTLMDDSRVNVDLIECVLGLVTRLDPPKPSAAAVAQAFVAALPPDGAVLVFLPGLADITRLQERLLGHRAFGNPRRFVVVVLHSSLTSSPKDQRVAFDSPPPGVTKIVLATNIAETGVTIPDVTCVVDTCRANEIDFDERRGGLSMLRERFISKANAQQRAGRAGRVRPGICVRLVYDKTFDKLDAVAVPEMLRVPLDDVVLRLLAARQPPLQFLLQAPDPPSQNAVVKALHRLAAIGAAALSVQSDPADSAAYSCTALGLHLARLPLDARVGKLLILGSIFKCLDQVLTVAAAAGAQSVFASGRNADVGAAKRQFLWGDSDLLTTCRAFEAWSRAPDPGLFARSHSLSIASLHALKRTRSELLQHLKEAGFPCVLERAGPEPQAEIVAAVLLAGLYPSAAAVELVRGPRAVAEPGRDVKVVCVDGVEAHLFNGSVAYGKGRGPLRPAKDGPRTRFVVYCERLKTSRIFLRDVTPIPPAALLLFSGADLELSHAKRRVDVDGWVHLRVPPRTAALFSRARVALDKELVGALDRPSAAAASSHKPGPAAQLAMRLVLASLD